MGITSWWRSWTGLSTGDEAVGARVNPATGLPMTGAVDVVGNPFGVELGRAHGADDVSSSGTFQAYMSSPSDPFGDAHRSMASDPFPSSGTGSGGGFDGGSSWSSHDPHRGW